MDVSSQTEKGWNWGGEVGYYVPAWSENYNNSTLDDSAVMVQYRLRYNGQPATGVTIIANITDQSGQRYWFKDGSSTLWDVIRYDGRDDHLKRVGDPIGESANDGVYANLIALGQPNFDKTKMFGKGPSWQVNITFYAPGRPIGTARTLIDTSEAQNDTVHWLESIDLNTTRTGQDWMVLASPNQTLNGSLVLNQTGHCGTKCNYKLSAWMAPYETSGQEYRIIEGNASSIRLKIINWTYKAPLKPGIYTMTISESFKGWWPHYNESVLFVGKIIVDDKNTTPKVELVSPSDGSEVDTYKPTLSWSSTGFRFVKPTYLVLMDEQNGSSFTAGRTDATSAMVEITGKRHQFWSVVAYDGFERKYSKVWDLFVKNDTATDRPPIVTLTSPMDGYLSNSSELAFSWYGQDPDGDQMTYVFQAMYRSNKTIVTTKGLKENNTKVWLPNGEYVPIATGSSMSMLSSTHSLMQH
jgi:hypothetical protein